MKRQNIKNYEIVAEKSIFLGKKCYIDQLTAITIDENGKTTKIDITDYHIRMKGVPECSILAKCIELEKSAFYIYEKIKSGEEIEFDLCKNANNEHISRFKRNKLFVYGFIEKFTRKIKINK